jgi:hypothetical protein
MGSWKVPLSVNRLEELKAREKALTAKRGVFIRDKNVGRALSLVKNEIDSLKKKISELENDLLGFI